MHTFVSRFSCVPIYLRRQPAMNHARKSDGVAHHVCVQSAHCYSRETIGCGSASPSHILLTSAFFFPLFAAAA